MIEVLLLVISGLLVAACGAFVAAEFSFVTVDRSTVEREAEAGDRQARGVLSSLKSLSTQLSAAQVGITVTNLIIGFMAEPAIARLVDGPLEAIGVPERAVSGIALIVAIVIATGFTMVFGELVPKNLAIAKPLATARRVQSFQRAFTRLTLPLIRVSNGTANAILRRLGIEPQEELASARSPEELASLVRRSAEQGTLEISTATLVERSLAFGEQRADDVMTPRGRMSSVQADAPVLRVVEVARESGHSRFPVMDDDRVVGMVHLKHAVAVPHERRGEVLVSEVMVPPALVPSSLDLDALLENLRQGGLQMALVVDEFGNVDGIVTLEDLIEEIVGEVHDEHDDHEDEARQDSRGDWTLSGLMRPDEIADQVGIFLPESEDYETLGGLIAARLGRMPEPEDRVELEAEDGEHERHRVRLTVLSLDELRVDRVRLESEPLLEGEAGEGAPPAPDPDGTSGQHSGEER
jgi:CBS domain containing-hemolysin-like protein